MTPQRARTYCWLFLAISVSILANICFMQPRTASSDGERRAMSASVATTAARSAEQLTDTVRAVQRELKELKLYPGQIDGKPSLLVSAAILAYEQAQTLPLTGEPSQAILREMIVGPAAASGAAGQAFGVTPGSAAEKVVREIRQKLVQLGYATGGGDGRMTVELIGAIRTYERDNNLPQTGRISAYLLLHLQRSAATFRTGSKS